MLFLGTSAAGLISLALADMAYGRQLSAFHLERVADRVESFTSAAMLSEGRGTIDQRLNGALGLSAPATDVENLQRDVALERIIRARLPEGWSVRAFRGSIATCAPGPPPFAPNPAHKRDVANRAQALGFSRPECWAFQLQSPDTAQLAFTVGTPPSAARARVFDPFFLLGLLTTTAVLSFFVARLASRPLERLARAAEALRDDLEAAPTRVSGPNEVTKAASALNSLQARLNEALKERSQILAAVTHDLQTPLTRLRLRVEKVSDEELKGRLLGDLATTQDLIREGLELARNQPSDEPFEFLALDTMLAALADDEADAGRPVVFNEGCGCDVHVRPAALRRCLANLIDNAVIHGGGAMISAHRIGTQVSIHVDDDGPGIAFHDLERVMQPFVRLDASRSRDTGGTGLGLPIAARLAAESNGRLELIRRAKGLSARVHVPGWRTQYRHT
ncbi:ATP-binding protein [Brevundimonas sp.]|uniref:ATP-binding protein n=1 Tax=Brevundimonas sp. TaxID=1871086 RepID=UPI00391A993D